MVDVGEAKNAAVNLFRLLDTKDELQIADEKHCKNIVSPINGNIEFIDVNFKYPSRAK